MNPEEAGRLERAQRLAEIAQEQLEELQAVERDGLDAELAQLRQAEFDGLEAELEQLRRTDD